MWTHTGLFTAVSLLATAHQPSDLRAETCTHLSESDAPAAVSPAEVPQDRPAATWSSPAESRTPAVVGYSLCEVRFERSELLLAVVLLSQGVVDWSQVEINIRKLDPPTAARLTAHAAGEGGPFSAGSLGGRCVAGLRQYRRTSCCSIGRRSVRRC